MGGKSEAKALMETAGVPLVPGYHGEDQSPELLRSRSKHRLSRADQGVGRRRRQGHARRDRADEFDDQLNGAKREAINAFGDDRVLIERYVTRPRHVEIQVFADTQGNCVHLFERDCSIQRRHQKVVEEAPAPEPRLAARRAMGEAAVAAAKAIGYVGAGTVEFIAGRGRLVLLHGDEHPPPGRASGDRIHHRPGSGGMAASRRRRRTSATTIRTSFRSTATPSRCGSTRRTRRRAFLPQTGRLEHLAFPPEDALCPRRHRRQAGDAISIHYDPMIAKLIVWADDRSSAVRRLRRRLSQTAGGWLGANTEFLLAIASHPAFLAADLDTGFIERHQSDLLRRTGSRRCRRAGLRGARRAAGRARQGASAPPPATRTAPGPATMAGA